MKDRPIIFSGPMVRALLEGRKTQTRRIAKPQFVDFKGQEFYNVDRCPYGKPGDLLWVREAVCIGYEIGRGEFTAIPFDGCEKFRRAFYRATDDDKPNEAKRPWRPSIHMPRWASRLTLRITEVRVQRLQEITHTDAELEGVLCNMSRKTFREHYADLWDHINGAGAWQANPWVWAITFAVVKSNVDAVMEAKGDGR